VLDFVHFGSTISVRSTCTARVSGGISVLDFLSIGSSLSVRGFHGKPAFGKIVSVLDAVQLGSSLSVRNLARVGLNASVLEK